MQLPLDLKKGEKMVIVYGGKRVKAAYNGSLELEGTIMDAVKDQQRGAPSHLHTLVLSLPGPDILHDTTRWRWFAAARAAPQATLKSVRAEA